MKHGWRIILLGILCRVAASMELFHHEIVNYPLAEAPCEAVSEQLAQQLSNHTGVEIYWAGPEKTGATHCDIKISYLAEKKLPFVVSVDRGLTTSTADKGAYAKAKQCEDALDFERRLFTEQTGIEPWMSYCYPEEWFFGRFSYVPVVEGIGQSPKRLFASEHLFNDPPVEGWDRLLADILSGTRNNGIGAATVFALPSISENRYNLTIRFYAPERLWLSTAKYALHSDAQICSAQVDYVTQGLKKAPVPPVAVYCSKNMGQHHLLVVGLSINIFGPEGIAAEVDPKRYDSLAVCLAEREKTEQFHLEKLGKKVLASFCFDEDKSKFRTLVLHAQSALSHASLETESSLIDSSTW